MDSGNEENNVSRIQFKHFDVVPEAKDHYFISKNTKKQFSNRKSYGKIMREWKILENNLPEGIYVQVYETRIDLLRAVIIGASGTPYHDGLFFFDIFLPFDYPRQPPLVHYHSHGYCLNPNLYKCGKVCLSLINTWNGKTTERWTENSSIVQVLVSIQGLVLNERPYFNEPGRQFLPCWFQRLSHEYNENVFFLSCKTMLRIIANPPENFDGFVAEHFRLRGTSILATILNYRKGNIFVGQMNRPSPGCKVSNKFRKDLMSVYNPCKIVFAHMISTTDLEKIEKMEKEDLEEIEEMENEESEETSSSSKSHKTMTKLKKMLLSVFLSILWYSILEMMF